jgi:hypothetical protein
MTTRQTHVYDFMQKPSDQVAARGAWMLKMGQQRAQGADEMTVCTHEANQFQLKQVLLPLPAATHLFALSFPCTSSTDFIARRR